MDKREFIARRVAKEFKDGDVVNLGIGLPTLVANFIPASIQVTLQSENGLLGLGPQADETNVNNNITDAGGRLVTVKNGASFFDSATSFGIIRGGHVNSSVLGALEVDEEGNLASWMIPGKMVTGMGGAMDLVVGAKRVIIAMEHVNKSGSPKILKKCVLPLTAANEVDLIVTDMAVIEVVQGKGLILKEIAPDISVEDVRNATGADFLIDKDLKIMGV